MSNYLDKSIVEIHELLVKGSITPLDLVEEVLSEIYEKLIYDNGNIYQIFNNNKLDKGAIGGIYEKYVIFNMSPENDGYDKILFGSIRVNKVYEVKKFLPNDNENWKKKKYEKKIGNRNLFI